MEFLHCGSFRLPLNRPLIMGIVNVTDDSFSGDGVLGGVESVLAKARRQLDEGADILDIGAESTRPGAPPVAEADELERLLPALRELKKWGVPISVDTYKPGVMRAVLAEGCAMINDISGMNSQAAIDAVAGSDCGICLMHMRGVPLSMQENPNYCDVVDEVRGYLREAVGRCLRAGISASRLVIDPGFGFGKNFEHNLQLFRELTVVTGDGYPVLAGVSRKSMLGQITGRPVAERIHASLAAALLAAQAGVKILRVHDVAATRDVLSVLQVLGGK